MEERLRILLAELEAQQNEMARLSSSIEEKAKSLKENTNNEDLTNSLAYKLHNLYSAYEDMFKLTAKFFENQIEDTTKYHTGLLRRMMLDIKGIRPALLSEGSFKILDELRGFRHVFRHAYSYDLDAERIIKLAERSLKLKDIFSKDLTAFKDKLTI